MCIRDRKPAPHQAKPQPQISIPPLVVEEIEVANDDEEVVEEEIVEEFFDIGVPEFSDDCFGCDGDFVDEPVPFVSIEHLPHFASCSDIDDRQAQRECVEQQLFRQLQSDFETPAIMHDIPGKQTAYIEFVIDVDGTVTNVICKNEERIHPALVEEATRAVQANNDWIPGEQRGRKVPVVMMIPISVDIR